ncbi:MAG: TRAP transporter small permease [Desulfatitalea sp.]|nr:TRAP transporter small permease [Desulfatitalea sp.]
MNLLWKAFQFLSDKSKTAGAVCLVGMTVLTCADIVGRLFKYPIFGSVELVTFMGALAVAFALPFTHQTNGHIGVELVVRRLTVKTRLIIHIVTGLAGFALFVVVAWRMAVYGLNLKQAGEVSMNLQLPEYLIVLTVAACFIVLTFVILRGVIEAFGQLRTK